MEDVNPYRPPAEWWSRLDLPHREESPRHCPHCLSDVTFRKTLKEQTPFRYTCPDCHSKCQIRSPWMEWIFGGICFASGLFLLVCVAAFFTYGRIIVLPALAVYLGWWLFMEVWTHRYIQRNGSFIVVDSGEVPEPSLLQRRQRLSNAVDAE